MYINKNIDWAVVYLIASVALLGAGIYQSFIDRNIFYGAICVCNIIAWIIALLIE